MLDSLVGTVCGLGAVGPCARRPPQRGARPSLQARAGGLTSERKTHLRRESGGENLVHVPILHVTFIGRCVSSSGTLGVSHTFPSFSGPSGSPLIGSAPSPAVCMRGTSPDARSPLSPGMVLVRSENGQLLMIPQQALAQMQAQAHVQTQPQTTMAPRPATPTSAPPVQISTVQVSACAPGGGSPWGVLQVSCEGGEGQPCAVHHREALRSWLCVHALRNSGMVAWTLSCLFPAIPDSTSRASVSSCTK